MTKQKIKACPFCGGEGKHLLLFGFHDYHCDRCGCSTKSYITEQDAFNAWNKRASDTETIKLKDDMLGVLEEFRDYLCHFMPSGEQRGIMENIINRHRKELQGE